VDVEVSWIDQRRQSHICVGGIGVQREPVTSPVGQGDYYACYVAGHSEDDLIGADIVVLGARFQPPSRGQRWRPLAALRVMSVGGLHVEVGVRKTVMDIPPEHPTVALERGPTPYHRHHRIIPQYVLFCRDEYAPPNGGEFTYIL
jgi:hypothetical protein